MKGPFYEVMSRAASLRNHGKDLDTRLHASLPTCEVFAYVSNENASIPLAGMTDDDGEIQPNTWSSYSQLSFSDLNEDISVLPVIACELNPTSRDYGFLDGDTPSQKSKDESCDKHIPKLLAVHPENTGPKIGARTW